MCNSPVKEVSQDEEDVTMKKNKEKRKKSAQEESVRLAVVQWMDETAGYHRARKKLREQTELELQQRKAEYGRKHQAKKARKAPVVKTCVVERGLPVRSYASLRATPQGLRRINGHSQQDMVIAQGIINVVEAARARRAEENTQRRRQDESRFNNYVDPDLVRKIAEEERVKQAERRKLALASK